ncbi:MAG: hypothetical protein V4699_03780, partial [Patescibacteria group bacterium]
IQFGGLSGFPTGSGTTASNATISGTSVVGWAKAISNGGGWDGWISLAGTGYGVTLPSTSFSGYAWGGDVVGWMSFDTVTINLSQPAGSLICEGSEGQCTIPDGTSTIITWSSTNTTSCTVTPGNWTGVSGSHSTGILTANAEYDLNCTGGTLSKHLYIIVTIEPFWSEWGTCSATCNDGTNGGGTKYRTCSTGGTSCDAIDGDDSSSPCNDTLACTNEVGTCSLTTRNHCTSGDDIDTTDTSSTWKWDCNGPAGLAHCTLPRRLPTFEES